MDLMNNFSENDIRSLKRFFKEARRLMTYYSCALFEVETKFRVLNQQFSLEQNYNPIETIRTRLKSPESIIRKLERKNLRMEKVRDTIEENSNIEL